MKTNNSGAAQWVLSLLAAVAVFTGVQRTLGADAEQVSVSVGQMQLVNTPFAVRNFRVANPGLVTVETQGSQQLRIMGVAAGTTDLHVTGDGNLSALYTLVVSENIQAVLAAVKRDLDTVPEVEVSINLGRVVLKGEVNSIARWQYLNKVVALYKDSVANLASFHPTPEVMLGLKDSLEKVGYTVVTSGEKIDGTKPGEISLNFSGNNIFVAGSVYSQKDVDRIIQVIDSQDWLKVVGRPAAAEGGAAAAPAPQEAQQGGADARIKAIVNLNIIPTMLEVDVVFVSVTDVEEKQIGVNLAKAGLITINSLSAGFQGDLGSGSSGMAGTYAINSGLAGALKFFAGSGPGRIRTAGHMTFKNDSPEWRTYHSGGTLKVRVASDNATSLEDVDYGLIMRVKGGLTDSKNTALDVNLELSYPVPIGADYDLKRNHIDTTVNCPIGQTLVLGGMKNLVEQTSEEGVPFLRSIPAISWFFSEKNNRKEDNKILIMLSPQIAGAPREALPVSLETAPAEQEVQVENKDRLREKRKNKRFFFF
jgi:Flp pilus assembly secretin CpaC